MAKRQKRKYRTAKRRLREKALSGRQETLQALKALSHYSFSLVLLVVLTLGGVALAPVLFGFSTEIPNMVYLGAPSLVLAIFGFFTLTRLAVTDRDLRKVTGKLRDKKNELDLLMEAFPVGVFIVTTAGRVRYANHHICAQLNVSPLEVSRRPWLSAGAVKDQENEAQFWKECLSQRKPYDKVITVKSEKGERWLKMRATPIKHDSAVLAYLGISLDVTEAEEHKRGVAEKLETIVESQDELLRTLVLLSETRTQALASPKGYEGKELLTEVTELATTEMPPHGVLGETTMKGFPVVAPYGGTATSGRYEPAPREINRATAPEEAFTPGYPPDRRGSARAENQRGEQERSGGHEMKGLDDRDGRVSRSSRSGKPSSLTERLRGIFSSVVIP